MSWSKGDRIRAIRVDVITPTGPPPPPPGTPPPPGPVIVAVQPGEILHAGSTIALPTASQLPRGQVDPFTPPTLSVPIHASPEVEEKLHRLDTYLAEGRKAPRTVLMKVPISAAIYTAAQMAMDKKASPLEAFATAAVSTFIANQITKDDISYTNYLIAGATTVAIEKVVLGSRQSPVYTFLLAVGANVLANKVYQ